MISTAVIRLMNLYWKSASKGILRGMLVKGQIQSLIEAGQNWSLIFHHAVLAEIKSTVK